MAVKPARCDANLTDALSHTIEIGSKRCPRASKPSEPDCVTGTPGNCVARTSTIDISSSLLSPASSGVSGTIMTSVRAKRTNEHSHAHVCARVRACARACAYRARRGDVARRKVRKFVAKKGRKTVSGRRDGDHIILQFYR